MVFFAGERPALDNSLVGSNFNAPRNLGFVHVSADMQSVLSPGATETGGFYTFGGGWTAQENSGIVWLTDMTPPATFAKADWLGATRIKTARLSDDMIVVFYEVWSATKCVHSFAFVCSVPRHDDSVTTQLHTRS
jgi:hypothetical protein